VSLRTVPTAFLTVTDRYIFGPRARVTLQILLVTGSLTLVRSTR
jgi:hypothetical protein